MNRFTADYSSSPAPTPNNARTRTANLFYNNTPELASTTPLAPPPSQVFGSSGLGSKVSKFQYQRPSTHALESSQMSVDPPFNPHQRAIRPFHTSTSTYEGYAEDGEHNHDDEDEEDEDMDEDDWEEEGDRDDLRSTRHTDTGAYTLSKGGTAQNSMSLMKFSTGPLRQPITTSSSKLVRPSQYSILPGKGNPDLVTGMSRDFCRSTRVAPLSNDSDDVIISTERIMRRLEEVAQEAVDNEALELILAACVHELRAQWYQLAGVSKRNRIIGSPIGPDKDATAYDRAHFLASFLLRLYHPIDTDRDQQTKVLSIPRALLEWLDEDHFNYAMSYEQVASTTPNCTSNELFWDLVESLTARGKFSDVMDLLAEADFAYAKTDTGDDVQDANYSGTELQSIQSAVLRARQTLNICPAVQNDDWDVNGQDWDIYRKQVEQALDALTELAEDHLDQSKSPHAQELSTYGLFAASTRKTRKGLPFEVYQHLRTMYSILLGSTQEIISISNDWVEASLLLTVWWNGIVQDNVARWSFDVSRAGDTNAMDHSGLQAYLTRLRESFLYATDPDQTDTFQLNSVSPIELGLGAVLQGDVPSLLSILETQSMCLTSALAEVGTWAGWFTSPAQPAGLNQEDLMVLTYGTDNTALSKDSVLERYAHALFGKPEIRESDGITVEGWEFAFSVTSRLDDRKAVQLTISEFTEEMQVTDKARAEKLVTRCDELELSELSRKVSESFADYLVDSSTEYGTAILCYAKSHAEQKVRQLIDLLNSYCLVESRAYPSDEEIDPALAQLVTNPKSALSDIALNDPDAVQSLQFHLVGYACIRRFYTLRDEGVDSTKDQVPSRVSEAKKRVAAKALVAAINSAADSIYGGLYDSERQSAIQVDGLLTLLGEATAFFDGGIGRSSFTSEQLYALLAAIEDLQAVNDRVYGATEECLAAALRNYHGSLPPSPHTMLKKSMSSGTNSNFSFSMMGSEMLARSEESLGGKSLGSAVLVGKGQKDGETVRRGWDWRTRFQDKATQGADVTRFLRLNIAQALSIACLSEGTTDRKDTKSWLRVAG